MRALPSGHGATSDWSSGLSPSGFQCGPFAFDAVLAAEEGIEVDSAVAVALAENLQVPLVTKNRAIWSDRISVLHG